MGRHSAVLSVLVGILQLNLITCQRDVVTDIVKSDGPPDIFLMGAGRAATTSLHSYLTTEGGLCGGTMKDYNYWEFKHEDVNTRNKYFGHFKDCKAGQRMIDGSWSNSGYTARGT
jgi:hypothetical protein